MPKKDIDHDLVKTALIKDGWTITHHPLKLEFGGINFFIDLGAEHLIAAEKETRKIAVEIKGFPGVSVVNEFHVALGQFMNYRLLLARDQPDRVLYLAVSDNIFDDFFELPFGRLAIKGHQLKILVHDPEKEEIIKWID